MSKSSPAVRRIGVSVMTVACAIAVAAGASAASGATAQTQRASGTTRAAASVPSATFSFALNPSSPGIKACMPHAGGQVTITRHAQNDTMKVVLHGMASNTTFALFVLQQPTKPFGLAWYQTDVNTNQFGGGSAIVQGVLNRETFSVSLGGAAKFAPTHMFHLGLWFDSELLPFNIGCEPGATKPITTPFDGDQGAGPQALNTAQFPVNAGPLSRVPD